MTNPHRIRAPWGRTDRIVVQEVGPRDGLQIEPVWIETAAKIGIIEECSTAGITRIEVSSFVSPKAVPTLRDAEAVFAGIRRSPATTYSALVPNVRGAVRAKAAMADELNLVMSSSDTHNFANMGMSREQSLEEFTEIAALTSFPGLELNGTIATAFGCPFEGEQPESKIISILERYLELGIMQVTLADTTGMANPRQVSDLVRLALSLVAPSQLTLHFHNTRGMGLANVAAAYATGARRFDASLGGMGGCPFAPGASGNVCTEDLVHMFDEMGIETGINLPALIALSRRLPTLLGHETAGQVAKAGRAADLHPVPPAVLAKLEHGRRPQ